MKMRMLDGAAQGFLRTRRREQVVGDRGGVVRGLVHHTLRDATGYVEGLSEGVVEGLLRRVREGEGGRGEG